MLALHRYDGEEKDIYGGGRKEEQEEVAAMVVEAVTDEGQEVWDEEVVEKILAGEDVVVSIDGEGQEERDEQNEEEGHNEVAGAEEEEGNEEP